MDQKSNRPEIHIEESTKERNMDEAIIPLKRMERLPQILHKSRLSAMMRMEKETKKSAQFSQMEPQIKS